MSRTINAACQTTDDRESGAHQSTGESFGLASTVGRAAARTDNPNRQIVRWLN
jgi:hypothetical protein